MFCRALYTDDVKITAVQRTAMICCLITFYGDIFSKCGVQQSQHVISLVLV